MISFIRRDAHSDFGTCIQWVNESQVLTCGDDHKLNLWNILNFVLIKTIKLPDDCFVTDLALFSGSSSASSAGSSAKRGQSSQQNQLKVILACTDGKFHFLNVTFEKIEKSIDAHQGALTVVKLSKDESAILTAGEDGQLKIWSKTGLLRNTITSESSPIHCALWSSDQSERILYSVNDQLNIRPLMPNSKTIRWIAHKGYVIRCVDWNVKFKLILSSDEVGSIKLWDSVGNHLRNVETKENLIASSLAWSRDGERFACGGHNFVLLGDRHGYLFSVQHLNERKRTKDDEQHKSDDFSLNDILNNQLTTAQSLMRIGWSNNSIASISTGGQLFYGFIINEIVQWSSYSLLILDSKRILIKNILVDYEQEFEFNDPIVRYSMKFGHLIVLSINQCYVYPLPTVDPLNRKSFNNTLNPTIIQLKDTNYFMILQSCTQFALVGQSSSIVLFNYQGRQMFAFKLGYGNRLEEELNSSMISLSEDTIAFRDPLDSKVIRFFDSVNGIELLRNKEVNTGDRRSSATKIEFRHEQEVISLKLNTNNCPSNERKCAFVDKNLDLYLTLVRPTPMKNYTTIKLINMCTSIQWNEQFDLLATIEQNTKLNIFIYPQSAFLDNDLLRLSTAVKQYDLIASQTGHQYLNVISFQRDQIRLANEQGSSITNVISPFYILLHSYINESRFDSALKLCRLNPREMNSYLNENRSSNDLSLWAAFTAMALNKRNLDMAEIGYASVEIFERVIYIKNVKKIYEKMISRLGANEPVNSSKLISAESLKKGELALICGNHFEAETIFLNAGFVVRCLFMQLNLFHWLDAVQLAKKYDHLCTDDLNKFLIKINKKELIDSEEENMLSRIVLTYRLNYLERYEIDETDSIFAKMSDQHRPLEWETVSQIQKEQYFFKFNVKKM